MIWLTLAGWLLRARQIASQVLSWLLGSTTRILACALCAALLWGYMGHRSAGTWRQRTINVVAELRRERAAASAAKAKAEQRYKDLANEADKDHAALVAYGDNRLAAYIAAHRLQPAKAHPASTAEDHGAAVPANPAPSQFVAPVAISEADLRICDANYAYARAAFDWAQTLMTAH